MLRVDSGACYTTIGSSEAERALPIKRQVSCHRQGARRDSSAAMLVIRGVAEVTYRLFIVGA
jgi:hypothetical protein